MVLQRLDSEMVQKGVYLTAYVKGFYEILLKHL